MNIRHGHHIDRDAQSIFLYAQAMIQGRAAEANRMISVATYRKLKTKCAYRRFYRAELSAALERFAKEQG